MTCTLGEVKNRADFIIYWGGNPAECHPRHFTKYTLTQKGKYIPNGRKDRTMVLVDIRETMSAKAADIFLQVRPGKDFEMLSILRALIKNRPVGSAAVTETGLTLEQLQDLVDRMEGQVRRALLRHGPLHDARQAYELGRSGSARRRDERLHEFVAMPMRGHGNVTGADVVLRYTTSYPFGISLTRGYPRLNPGEYSTIDLLVRGDNDATLVLGRGPRRDHAPAGHRAHETHTHDRARPQGHAHEQARPRPHHHGRDRHQRAGDRLPHGRDSATAALLKSPYPTDEDVLKRIVAAVRKKPAWQPEARRGADRVRAIPTTPSTIHEVKAMRIYEKSVRELMRDMVTALVVRADDSFTKQQATDWFKTNIEDQTEYHNRTSYRCQPTRQVASTTQFAAGQDDLFFRLGGGRFRLYDQLAIHLRSTIQPEAAAEGEPIHAEALVFSLPVIANQQTVGNIGLYYVCYRLSRLGWNVMPTTRTQKASISSSTARMQVAHTRSK